MIRRHALPAAALAVAAMLHAACAPTPPPAARTAPVEPDAAAPASAERGVTLRAEALGSPARQQAMLGSDLSRRGVVALLVRVENGGAATVDLRSRDLVLERGEARIRPTGPAMIGSLVGEGAGVTAAGFAGAALLGVPGGLLASAAASQSNREAMHTQSAAFAAIGLRDGPLAPGTATSGFVFFTPPPSMGAFDDAALVLRSGDPGMPGGLVIRVPLTGLNYRPSG